MQLIITRNDQWKRYKFTNRTVDWEEYVKTRNLVKSRIRVWEEEEERSRIKEFKGNKKRFYGYMRSKQQVKTTVNHLKKGNNELTVTDLESAEVLNQFFRSVFVNEGSMTQQKLAVWT